VELVRVSILRVILLAVAAAVFGVTVAAGPAAADVAIEPTEVAAGEAVSVTFQVRNQRAGAHTTKVVVQLPRQAPIAEVFPMSVDDWAPSITYRKADRPLPGIHGGGGLIHATDAVTWTRVDGAAAPPAVEQLRLEMGPIPQVSALALTVVQTYSDGTVQRWSPALTVTSGQTADRAASQAAGPDGAGTPAAVGGESDSTSSGAGGISGSSIFAWVAGAIGIGILAWVAFPIIRSAVRSGDSSERTGSDGDPQDDDPPMITVSMGSSPRKWGKGPSQQ
jgi:hypothetical protein